MTGPAIWYYLSSQNTYKTIQPAIQLEAKRIGWKRGVELHYHLSAGVAVSICIPFQRYKYSIYVCRYINIYICCFFYLHAPFLLLSMKESNSVCDEQWEIILKHCRNYESSRKINFNLILLMRYGQWVRTITPFTSPDANKLCREIMSYWFCFCMTNPNGSSCSFFFFCVLSLISVSLYEKNKPL